MEAAMKRSEIVLGRPCDGRACSEVVENLVIYIAKPSALGSIVKAFTR